tara:strand:+ start:461 stop:1087 length:627 start_codon:yes stop_codon:yes gene_type:complete
VTKTLLILRHAERPAIEDGTVGDELALTQNGIDQTARFAQSLSQKVLSIESSPILRCTQTADIIARHHGFPLTSVRRSTLLGDPGFFIKDAELAWTNWLEQGVDAVNQHLLSGTSTWPGFKDLDQAVGQMGRSIKERLTRSEDGIHLWVTHDTIVATLASRLQKIPLELSDWPDYLGGLRVELGVEGSLDISYSQRGFGSEPTDLVFG